MRGRGWAYAGAILGAGVSVAANVLHSYVPPAAAPAGWRPPAGAVVGAVFWPVALLVALEILARVAWPDGARWQWLRYGGLVPVALVAAVVSYRHMSGLLAWYREDALTVAIGPLAVDGLMVMAAGALIATGRLHPTSAEPLNIGEASAKSADASHGLAAAEASPPASPQPVGLAEAPAVVTPPDVSAPLSPAARKVVRAHIRWPELSNAELAKRAKVSAASVTRHRPTKPSVNGHKPEMEE